LLTFTMAVSYAFEFTAGGALVLFYQASIQMGLFFVVWLVLEYLRIGSRPARLVRAVACPGPAERGCEVGVGHGTRGALPDNAVVYVEVGHALGFRRGPSRSPLTRTAQRRGASPRATTTREPYASTGRTPRPYPATWSQSQPTQGVRESISLLIADHSSAAARPSARWRALDSITRTSRAPSPSSRLRAVRVASTDAWMRVSGSGAERASKPSAEPRPVE